jgi:uncharacterized protein
MGKVKIKEAIGEKIGSITAISTPTEFQFHINATKHKPKVHDFVVIEHPTETDVPLLAKITRISRYNPLIPEEAAFEFAKLDVASEMTPLPISGKLEMNIGFCTILGYVDEFGNLRGPGYPTKPGSEVYLPSKTFMVEVLGENINGLYIGNLRNRKDVAINLIPNAILNRHLAILAMTGSGKTYASSVILEELMKKGYPLLILDPHGDYVNLNNNGKGGFNYQLGKKSGKYKLHVFDNTVDLAQLPPEELIEFIKNSCGEIVSDAQIGKYTEYVKICKDKKRISSFLSTICSDENKHSDEEILDLEDKLQIKNHGLSALYRLLTLQLDNQTKDSATHLAMIRQLNKITGLLAGVDRSLTLEEIEDNIGLGKGVVLNMVLLPYQIQRVSAYIILKRLFEKRKRYVSSKDNKYKTPPLYLVIEEAHNFAPAQIEDEDFPSRNIIRRIAAEGRKFGIGLCVISQRPSRLDQTVLSQCNSQIILRIVNPHDQNYIGATVESLGGDDIKTLQDLSTGEALVSGQTIKIPSVVRVRQRESKEGIEEQDRFDEILLF